MNPSDQGIVRKAELLDLWEVKKLADHHRRELGFVRRAALNRSILRGEVFLATLGATPCGFAEYHHRRDDQTTLYHIAVEEGFRKLGIGARLLAELQREAIELGKKYLVLVCPSDLPANKFYNRLGFVRVGSQAGQKRTLNEWRLRLADSP